jgi:hypothetical protein
MLSSMVPSLTTASISMTLAPSASATSIVSLTNISETTDLVSTSGSPSVTTATFRALMDQSVNTPSVQMTTSNVPVAETIVLATAPVVSGSEPVNESAISASIVTLVVYTASTSWSGLSSVIGIVIGVSLLCFIAGGVAVFFLQRAIARRRASNSDTFPAVHVDGLPNAVGDEQMESTRFSEPG